MSLYQQLTQFISLLIEQQRLARDGKLPSERDLQDRFDASRIVIRDVLAKLEMEGIIYRQNRRGWFVCPKKLVCDPHNKINFDKLADEQGLIARTELKQLHTLPATPSICQAFDFKSQDEDAQVHELLRVRYLNERPVLVEEMQLSAERFPKLPQHNLSASVSVLLEQEYDCINYLEQNRVMVTRLDETAAQLLHLSVNAPALKVVRKRFDQNDRLISQQIEYWAYGAIELAFDA